MLPLMQQTLLALQNGGGAANRFPVVWSESHKARLRGIAQGGPGAYSGVDRFLAEPLLRCADGGFVEAEAIIVGMLADQIDICRNDEQTFISFLTAAFVVQRFDLVRGLLKDRYGFACDLEIMASQDGPGAGRVRWEISASGKHCFTFDAAAFTTDKTRNEILGFNWGFPIYAHYAALADQETGGVVINQQDIGQTPGLAWCDNRPDYFLVPDCVFVPSAGYAWARRVFAENPIAWQDRAPTALWRGSTTGLPATPNNWRSLERIRLCEIGRRHQHTGLIDAGISAVIQFDDPRVIAEIEASGLVRGPVPWPDWNRYRFLIDIDGNSSPWSNLFQRLLTGSTVLKVESMRGLRQWFYDELVPWQNYVPVAPDMSDLMDKIGWLARNDTAAQRIGAAGRALAESLTYEREVARSGAVISAAFRYFNGCPDDIGAFGQPWRDLPAAPAEQGAETVNAAELLREKHAIEAELGKTSDAATKSRYLGVLQLINRHFCGIMTFRWPGVPSALFMRCGSSDLANFVQIFDSEEYGFALPIAPKRIVDLGAYAGFASLYLAIRFPDAEILSVEPSAANFQMLTLNTGLYGRIRRINCAVWGRRSTLAVESRAGGDWGMRMAEATGAEGVIPALSLEDLLVHAGWDRFDFLKCDIEGAEAEVFAASGATIAGMVDCCAVETHDTLVPSSSDMVRATFDPALFSYDRSGEFDVFMRRDISPLPVPPRLSLFRPAIGARDLRLRNVPEQPWAYYMFDVDSCQLHPNERSEPVAEVSTTMSLDGQAVFACRVAVENPLGNAVEFIVEISDELTGRQAALAKTVVAAGAVRDFRVPLSAALSGLHRVALRTIMSEAGATSHQAVASWIEPAFLGGDASPAS